MKHYLYTLVSAAAMLLLACCSSDSDIAVSADEAATSTQTGTISFKIGSSSASSAQLATRDTYYDDETTLQSEQEAEVTSIYAVVFMDDDTTVSDGGTYYSGITGVEDDDADTYYDCIQIEGIDDNNPLEEDTEYTFKLEDDGNYQIIFLANPSETLISSIEALTVGTSTVADFKAITVDDDPSTKPMLMTSTLWYGIVSEQDTELDVIYLQRIMARIDIVNIADGITITKAVVNNLTTKSILFNDDDYTSYANFVVATTEYDFTGSTYGTSPLLGNSTTVTDDDGNETDYTDGVYDPTASDRNASMSQIYSYEQYAYYGDEDDYENATGEYLPSVTIYYYQNGDANANYTHEVKFLTTETTTDDDGVESTTKKALCIERNHYYRIVLSYNTESQVISVALITVQDWQDPDDSDFTVTVEEISNDIETNGEPVTDDDTTTEDSTEE